MHKLLQSFRSLIVIALPLALAVSCQPPASAQAFERPSLQPRIVQAVDDSSLVTLHGNTHPLAQVQSDTGPAPVSMPTNRLILVLTRSAQQEADLQVYLQSLQDANSPNYHRYLTPVDFGRRFGVQDEDLQAVQTWLTGHGFSINKISAGRTAIEFSGTVAQLQSAFHTPIRRYLIGEQQHWANASDPRIPSALAPVVAGIAALNSFKPRAQNIRGPDGIYDPASHSIKPAYTTGSARTSYYLYLTPADAATIYDTPTLFNANHTGSTLDGTGVTIGIAGDSNITLSQNANYRATFGLPAKPTTVVVDGNDPGINGDALEAYLDTQVAGGIAPNANIVLYTAADTDLNYGLFLAIQRALDDNQVDILNVSFGACESAQGAAGNQYILNLWEQAAAQGIAVTVSSGDSGSAGCDNPNQENTAAGLLAVNGLASTPFNIAVGGTDFDVLYSNFPSSFTQYVNVNNSLPNHRSALKYIPEEPWNNSTAGNAKLAQNIPWYAQGYPSLDNIQAAGGGASNCIQGTDRYGAGYPVPSWQSAFAADKTGRNLPDVSLLAGNGLYGALWGICTDLEVNSSATPVINCVPGSNSNSFNLTGVGGTSAAAPAFAGILALAQQKAGSRLGQADYVLYGLAASKYSSVFHDVTVGNNSVECNLGGTNCEANKLGYPFMTGFNAGVGYDEASGLGSVDATQLVNNWTSPARAATTLSLQFNGAATPLTLTHGKNVTVNAAVASPKGTPSGVVGLVDSISPATTPASVALDQFILNSTGLAAGQINNLPGGHYTVSAHYGGSPTFAQSASNAISVTVAPESSSTTLQVSAHDPLVWANHQFNYGFYSLLDAQPFGNSSPNVNGVVLPDGIPTGIVTFKSGSTTMGKATLNTSGIAELQTTTLPAGTYNISAAFPGDASFLPSTSAPQPITIQKATTVVDIPVVVPAKTVMGKPVSLSTKLWADSLGNPPTGTVTFIAGSTPVAQAPVTGISAAAPVNGNFLRGTAKVITTTIPPGVYIISPSYAGDSNYAAGANAESATLTVTGSGSLKPTITLAQSPNPAYTWEPLNLTVTLAGPSANPSPTGPVYLSAHVLGQNINDVATLKAGSATFTLPAHFTLFGGVQFTVYFPGDANYASATSSFQIVINEVTPSFTLTPAVTALQSTQALSVSVKATGSIPGTPPTGFVILNSSGSQSNVPTLTLVKGVATATLPPGFLGLGNVTLTATYLGDENYTYATGSTNIKVAGLPPATMTATPIPNPVSANQPLNIVVTVAGGSGNPIPAGLVSLTGGGYYSSGSPLSGGQTTITIGAEMLNPGAHTFTLNYDGGGVYTPSRIPLTVTVTAPAASVSVVSGASQSTVYGSPFARPLVVLVTDANKNPLSGVTVYFGGAGLQLSSSTAVTGKNGQASVSATAIAIGALPVTAGVDNIPQQATFSLTATKAQLTVAADNLSVAYNQPIPPLTFSFTGFVNGDTWRVVGGWPTLTTTAKQGSPTGAYPITIVQGTLAATNYAFTFTNGTLTITH